MIPVISGYIEDNYPIGRVCISLNDSKYFKIIGVAKDKEFFKSNIYIKLIKYFRNYIPYLRECISSLRARQIIIVAPTKIDLFSLSLLIFFAKKIAWLHMDNSYFCKSEYNFNYVTRSECFECIKNKKAYRKFKCKFPKKPSILYFLYEKLILKIFQRDKKSLIHLCQSSQSYELVKEYEKSISVHHEKKIIGLISSDFLLKKPKITTNVLNFLTLIRSKYRFVCTFHGSHVASKGAFHIPEIGKNLNNVAFILPFDKKTFLEEYYRIYKKEIHFDLKNLFFKELNSQTGLIDLLDKSDAQMIFSSWSSPIEIALIKSLQLKSPLITFCTSGLNTTSEIHNQFIKKTGKGLQIKYPLHNNDYVIISKQILSYLEKARNDICQNKKFNSTDISLPCYNKNDYAESIRIALLKE